MSQFKISTDKNKIDKELLAFSGSTTQYEIDMENFLNGVKLESEKRQSRKKRYPIKRKSKKKK
jgi:hypothetical protein